MDHKCNEVLKNSWIVDFACYFHIYLKKECFDTYKEYDGDSIALELIMLKLRYMMEQ
jgi:hypothetical protein